MINDKKVQLPSKGFVSAENRTMICELRCSAECENRKLNDYRREK